MRYHWALNLGHGTCRVTHATLARFFFRIFLIQFLTIKWYLFSKKSQCSTEKGKSEAALRWRAASSAAEIRRHVRSGWERERRDLRAKTALCHGKELSFSCLSCPTGRMGQQQYAPLLREMGLQAAEVLLACLKHIILKSAISYWNPHPVAFPDLCLGCEFDGIELLPACCRVIVNTDVLMFAEHSCSSDHTAKPHVEITSS